MTTAGNAPFEPTATLIYCVVDASFYAIARLFIRLLRQNYPDHPDVFFHAVNLDAAQVQNLASPPRVRCEPVRFDAFDGFPVIAAHCGASAQSLYGRFHIWKDGFHDYGNIIYIDIDTVVLGSLQHLCTMREFFIVKDVYSEMLLDAVVLDPTSRTLNRLFAQDRIPPRLAAANGGVFVVPRRYRTADAFDEIVTLGHRYRDYLRWADQSVLNLWIAYRDIQVSSLLAYNYQYSLLRPGPISDEIRIVHLNGMTSHVRLAVMWVALHTRRFDTRLILFSTLCWAWNIVGDWITGALANARSRVR
jgi:hypothetical protein